MTGKVVWPSFSTIEPILRKLSWGVGGWRGWGRILSLGKAILLQGLPMCKISARSTKKQENWFYWGVGGLGVKLGCTTLFELRSSTYVKSFSSIGQNVKKLGGLGKLG